MAESLQTQGRSPASKTFRLFENRPQKARVPSISIVEISRASYLQCKEKKCKRETMTRSVAYLRIRQAHLRVYANRPVRFNYMFITCMSTSFLPLFGTCVFPFHIICMQASCFGYLPLRAFSFPCEQHDCFRRRAAILLSQFSRKVVN